jgi:glucan phosphoethanolaminetransferase (alkaline phosphatase superfamily)
MSTLLACLSPEEIGISMAIGRYAAAFAILASLTLLLVNWRRRDFRWLPVYGALLLVHPAWSMSVYTGDCGYAERFMSVAVSVVFAAVLLCQVFRRQLRIRWFLLVLSGVCWIAFGAAQLYWQIVDYTFLIGFLARVFSSSVIEAFLFASPTLFKGAIVVTVVCALLYGFSWSRRPPRAV